MGEATYTFPAVKGLQAGTEYYISMVPLSTLPHLFLFSEEELPPEVRAQRILNKGRIPEIREYILKNPASYVFSSLTVSVDGPINFEPLSNQENIGSIIIPMSARFLINDGQHRKAAIEEALKKNSRLKYEHISVVFFGDTGLKRSQQIFSDLNRYAIRPTKSLNILFDNRSEFSSLVRDLTESLCIFKGWVEKERSTIPNRSKALFTLSGIYHGTEALLEDMGLKPERQRELVFTYWDTVSRYMNDWQDVLSLRKKASELRKQSVSAHAITLIALGRVGNKLLKEYNDLDDHLQLLAGINWSKDAQEWAGRVVIDGHVSATRSSVQALTETIAQVLFEGRR